MSSTIKVRAWMKCTVRPLSNSNCVYEKMFKVRSLTKLYVLWREDRVCFAKYHVTSTFRVRPVEDAQWVNDWNLYNKRGVHIHQELLSEYLWLYGPIFYNSELKLKISDCRKCLSPQIVHFFFFLTFLFKLLRSSWSFLNPSLLPYFKVLGRSLSSFRKSPVWR